MYRYILRRLLLLVVVLIGISLISFVLTRVIPGDPARLLAGPQARPEQVAAFRHRYGLDAPLPQQYLTYMSGLLRGDWGMSLTTRRPVRDDIEQFLPATLELTLAAVILTITVGIPLGVLAAVRPGRLLDQVIRMTTITALSFPIFWFGIILQILFFARLGILPVGGRIGILDIPPPTVTGAYLIDSLLAGDFSLFLTALKHLILPAVTLASGGIGMMTLVTRSTLIEALDADHIRTAHAKGLPARVVLLRHALRNALIPTITVLGLQIGWLLSGNFLIESVFNWPGLGLYAVTAIRNLDYWPIMTVTIIVAFIYVVVNLLVDIIYVVLDPRITYQTGTAT